MDFFRKFWPILVGLIGLALIPLNTDVLIPLLRGFFPSSVLVTVVGVSILANLKIFLAFHGVGKLNQGQSREPKNRFLLWAWTLIKRSEVLAIVILTIIPFPGLRTVCTAWCSGTQSWQGLTALMVANPIHVWSVVWGLDWILGR